jgi:DNA-binding CsgD family transcriptional regulator
VKPLFCVGMGDERPNRPLLGRRRECETLDHMLQGARAGVSGVLVVRGEAGIGKTALLDYAVDSASDYRVIRVVGVESETELAFAALHQLCLPLLDQLDRLPSPQRNALATVFGLSAGVVNERLLVSLGVLNLLSQVSDQQPLLCVIDDAQWLDHASAQTLGFVARRLMADSVGMVIAARALGVEFHGIPELEVGGLRDRDARALLESVVRGPLDAMVRDQIVAESRGNPLALLELPGGLSQANLAGGYGLLSPILISGGVEERFERRIVDLPVPTQLLVLVAAADSVGNPAVVWQAAARLGISKDALAPAEQAGLIEIESRVQFRHPSVRSAVYRSASVDNRRRAHQALAEVTDPEVDPDRRAWHWSQAAVGLDDELAAELEHSASRAQDRGGMAAAAAFLEQSAKFTAEPALRSARTLAAADYNVQAGAFDRALEQLAAVESGTLDDFGRAKVELLRSQIASSSGDADEAAARLFQAASRLESFDVTLCRDTYLHACHASIFAGNLAQAAPLETVSLAAKAAPRPTGAARPADLLLDGLTLLVTEGATSAAPLLAETINIFARQDIAAEQLLQFGIAAGTVATTLWDYEGWIAVVTRQVELVRDSGAFALLPVVLTSYAMISVQRGDFERAESMFAEVQAVVDATGSRFVPYGPTWLAALRGHEEVAFELIDVARKEAFARGEGHGVQWTHWLTAVLCNGLGRYEEAVTAAQLAVDVNAKLFLQNWALVELVEAAARCQMRDVADDALERLTKATGVVVSDWAMGVEARSRAFLNEGTLAEGFYQEAITRLGRTVFRCELARAHLSYGEWLRRARRRIDAREQLQVAYEMFVSMGASAFAERTRIELLATGATVRQRVPGAAKDLTAQEAQVCRLAAEGATNGEIAARLFVSPSTVEYHLRKAFRKLGISRRRQLATRLAP